MAPPHEGEANGHSWAVAARLGGLTCLPLGYVGLDGGLLAIDVSFEFLN